MSVRQSGEFADAARHDVQDLVDGSLARITDGVYDVVATQGDSTSAAVDKDMTVAQYVAAQAGGLGIASPARGRWVMRGRLCKGQKALVPRRGVRDRFGNFNGKASATVSGRARC